MINKDEMQWGEAERWKGRAKYLSAYLEQESAMQERQRERERENERGRHTMRRRERQQ